MTRTPNNTFVNSSCLIALGAALVCAMQTGCAVTYAKHAVPSYRLPDELKACSRSEYVPINYAMLRQHPKKTYLLGPGDLVGVYVHGVVPPQTEQLPLIEQRGLREIYYPPGGKIDVPSMGIPITVQANGTLVLPLVQPIPVAGKTLDDVTVAVRDAYIEEELLQEGRERVFVQLIRPRVHRVLVVREDAPAETPTLIRKDSVPLSKKGSAQVIDLPVGENDVLHALSASGGLPGVDTHNRVWILRSKAPESDLLETAQDVVQGFDNPEEAFQHLGCELTRICIPLRVRPCDALPFGPDDIVLEDGDILYLEPRIEDVFYTGGLLPGGQIPLPRDHDLDVLEAIALANGSVGGPGGVTGISVFRSSAGPGNIVPPTQCLILRRLPNGQQIPIRVDLAHAMHDEKHRILIQPEDLVMLHYKPHEQFANVTLNFFDINLSLSEIFK
ncbi:MAG: polysaccharide biosynthesis/export family protein [Planctomycetales bacterium]|nr:polysaccharide biosynthesis/export family protein [Planctomycetales bacterium]